MSAIPHRGALTSALPLPSVHPTLELERHAYADHDAADHERPAVGAQVRAQGPKQRCVDAPACGARAKVGRQSDAQLTRQPSHRRENAGDGESDSRGRHPFMYPTQRRKRDDCGPDREWQCDAGYEGKEALSLIAYALTLDEIDERVPRSQHSADDRHDEERRAPNDAHRDCAQRIGRGLRDRIVIVRVRHGSARNRSAVNQYGYHLNRFLPVV